MARPRPYRPDEKLDLSNLTRRQAAVFEQVCIGGWQLESFDYEDGDGFGRTVHEAVHDDGRRVRLDTSDFCFTMSPENFAALVRLGFPTRLTFGSNGPLSNTDLDMLRAA